MPEYISREYLLAEYDRQHQGPPGGARKIIVDAPASDVVEVRHGRWREVENGESGHLCECSACKEWMLFYYDFVANYCPNCGAKMDGGQDE